MSSEQRETENKVLLTPTIAPLVKVDQPVIQVGDAGIELLLKGSPNGEARKVEGPGVSIMLTAPKNDTSKKENFISPQAKSLLGADLVQSPASLSMPPPLLTKVKKARNLVSPGMSMVKWMKLQETRVRVPTRRKIPLSEIAKHNTESDCWMVIRNCVYDVTEYIPYHPGGVPELMKGAGKDGTALFNEIHKWVNFDSILKSCLLGYLLVDVGESFDEAEEEENVENRVTKSLLPFASQSFPLPRVAFTQNDSSVIFQVDTSFDGDISEDNWCVSVLNREFFLLKVILKPPDMWMSHVKLVQSLNDDSIRVNFQNSFKKAVIMFNKPSTGKWNSLGLPLQDNNRIMDSRQIQMNDFITGTLVVREEVTRDVILIGVQVTTSAVLGVPTGFHVKLRLHDAPELTRKYTPVNKSVINNDDNKEGDKRIIYFIIKIYPEGQLTKHIGQLKLNSTLELGAVAGRHDSSFFRNCDTLLLFAGGSGITPFVRIVDFLRKRSATYPVSRVILIFFNHTEQDIIWNDQWKNLANIWDAFHYFPVISKKSELQNENDSTAWTGLTGRVDNSSLFQSILLQVVSKEKGGPQENIEPCQVGKVKVMMCGSSGFNDACVTMLGNQTIVPITSLDEDVFLF